MISHPIRTTVAWDSQEVSGLTCKLDLAIDRPTVDDVDSVSSHRPIALVDHHDALRNDADRVDPSAGQMTHRRGRPVYITLGLTAF